MSKYVAITEFSVKGIKYLTGSILDTHDKFISPSDVNTLLRLKRISLISDDEDSSKIEETEEISTIKTRFESAKNEDFAFPNLNPETGTEKAESTEKLINVIEAMKAVADAAKELERKKHAHNPNLIFGQHKKKADEKIIEKKEEESITEQLEEIAKEPVAEKDEPIIDATADVTEQVVEEKVEQKTEVAEEAKIEEIDEVTERTEVEANTDNNTADSDIPATASAEEKVEEGSKVEKTEVEDATNIGYENVGTKDVEVTEDSTSSDGENKINEHKNSRRNKRKKNNESKQEAEVVEENTPVE